MHVRERFFSLLSVRAAAFGLFMTAGFMMAPVCAQAIEPQALPEGYEPKVRNQSMYVDMYDENFHKELSHFFRDAEILRQFRRDRLPALDVNSFDEVPDSLFFTNRHGKARMSTAELKSGQNTGAGPKEGPLSVIKGKNLGRTAGMFVRDANGDRYLLKFDPLDNSELITAAESISSRIFHAIGYNVPEYHVTYLRREQLAPATGARYYGESGFEKVLTQESIDEILAGVPQRHDGRYRASASKLLSGRVLGRDSLKTRRKKDPNDTIWHRDRRTMRALRVFGSWVNYYDLFPQNTMETLETVNGTPAIKHYIIDFASSLGSAGYVAKPPMYGFEHAFDYGEILKSVFSLGFYHKRWQRRVDEPTAVDPLPAVGPFDNRYFDPGKWKVQLPSYVFKELTPADAFWAAKIVMAFRDEDIRAIVETGEYSNDEARDEIVRILSERRDIIGRYWFGQVSPLEAFDVTVSGPKLTVGFTDLAVAHNFEEADQTIYHYALYNGTEIKNKFITVKGDILAPPLHLEEGILAGQGTATLALRAKRGSGDSLPPVYVVIENGQVIEIRH